MRDSSADQRAFAAGAASKVNTTPPQPMSLGAGTPAPRDLLEEITDQVKELEDRLGVLHEVAGMVAYYRSGGGTLSPRLTDMLRRIVRLF